MISFPFARAAFASKTQKSIRAKEIKKFASKLILSTFCFVTSHTKICLDVCDSLKSENYFPLFSYRK